MHVHALEFEAGFKLQACSNAPPNTHTGPPLPPGFSLMPSLSGHCAQSSHVGLMHVCEASKCQQEHHPSTHGQLTYGRLCAKQN